ncbi:NHL repeat-containing protein [Nocardia terpenica]|uniref:SMP-30/Gluconolactonase/LRE-like region domain-containing protein n=1 Tax=Nocardia terpenica TaxID=455432 RepID=A0A161Z9G6_9NOCA|nr:NHL repeat-containing protein [Nocardia terpenica]KZM75732.1 hypothetical protein AWN90_20560 [Nocardia terpenica]NQE86247.1 hypothetical protein [Nocardia terpenica]
MTIPTYTAFKLQIPGLGITVGVDIDDAGNTFIANRDSKQILQRSPDGVVAPLALTGLSDPYGVKVDPSGRVLVVDYGRHEVIRFTPATGKREVLPFVELRFPTDVDVDFAGRILVVDGGNRRVVRLTNDIDQETVGTGEVEGIHGIAIDSSGAAYVTQRGGGPEGLYRFADGKLPELIATNGLDGPAGVDVGSDGTIYVANGGQAQHSSTVALFNPDGTLITLVKTCEPLSSKPCVMRPLALALDQDGNITVIGYQPEAIQLIRNP